MFPHATENVWILSCISFFIIHDGCLIWYLDLLILYVHIHWIYISILHGLYLNEINTSSVWTYEPLSDRSPLLSSDSYTWVTFEYAMTETNRTSPPVRPYQWLRWPLKFRNWNVAQMVNCKHLTALSRAGQCLYSSIPWSSWSEPLIRSFTIPVVLNASLGYYAPLLVVWYYSTFPLGAATAARTTATAAGDFFGSKDTTLTFYK